MLRAQAQSVVRELNSRSLMVQPKKIGKKSHVRGHTHTHTHVTYIHTHTHTLSLSPSLSLSPLSVSS